MSGRPSHSTGNDYVPKHFVRQHTGGKGSISEYGSIEIDLCDGLLRIHNEVVPGGVALVQLIPNCGPNMMLPPPIVPADIAVTSATPDVIVRHNTGIYPIVQVLNSAGAVMPDADVSIQHQSANAFTVRFVTAQAATIIYRF